MPTTNTAVELIPIEQNEIASRDMIRKFQGIRPGGELIKIPYEQIKIRPGFNVRQQLGNLHELGDLIEAAGLINPIVVDVLKDGTVYLTDGERRYRAIGLIRERSAELRTRFANVKAIANSKETTELDRIVTMVTSPTSKPLEDIEEAAAYVRMLGEVDHEGKTIKAADIARITGKSTMHVSNRLRLAGVSDEEKIAVMNKEISATALTELVKQGYTEEERLQKISEAKQKEGKLKVKKVMKPEPIVPNVVFLDPLPPIDDEDDETAQLANDRLMDDEEAQYGDTIVANKPRSKNLVDIMNAAVLQARTISNILPSTEIKALDILHRLEENLRNAKKIAEALK